MSSTDYYKSAVYKFDTELREHTIVSDMCTEQFCEEALYKLNLNDVVVGYTNHANISKALISEKGDVRIDLCDSTIRNNCFLTSIHEIAHVVHYIMLTTFKIDQAHGLNFQAIHIGLLRKFRLVSDEDLKAAYKNVQGRKPCGQLPLVEFTRVSTTDAKQLIDQFRVEPFKRNPEASPIYRWDDNGVSNTLLYDGSYAVLMQMNRKVYVDIRQ